MDTVLLLTGAGVIIAAVGVAATVVIWVLRSVFNLGGLHMKVDALNERVGDLSRKVDDLAEGQRALHADLNRVINMLTALANHRHDVDGNTMFNVPPNA